MLKKTLVAAVAACAMAAGTVALTTPADAAAHFGVYVGPSAPPSGPRACWHWSNRADSWVWTCKHYSKRNYGPYAYRDYGPYDASPTFGFSFGFGGGGDRHHRHHMD